MLLALVLAFDQQHGRGGGGYLGYAACGYAVGLVTALAAGLLTSAPQPALLYLVSGQRSGQEVLRCHLIDWNRHLSLPQVPSTLGPILVVAWCRNELAELWSGPRTPVDKYRLPEA